MNLTYFLSTILIINLLLGVVFFFTNKNRFLNFLFGFLYINLCAWILSIVMVMNFGPFVWREVAFISLPLMILGLVIFAHLFPKAPKKIKWLQFWYVIPVFLYSVVTAVRSDLLVYGEEIIDNQIHVEYGPLIHVERFIYVTYAIAAIVLLFSRLRKEKNIILKTQLKYITAGSTFFLVTSSLTSVILPAFNIFDFNLIAPIITIPLVISITYAITHYRFLDLQIIFRKFLTYSTVILLSVGLVLILVKETSPFFYLSNRVMAGIIFIFAVFYFESVFSFITRLYLNLIPASKNCSQILKKLSSSLESTLNLDEITQSLFQQIPVALGTSQPGGLYLKNENQFTNVKSSQALEYSESLGDLLAESKGSLTADEVEMKMLHDTDEKYQKAWQSFSDLNASIVLPLKKENELIGFYVLEKSQKEDRVKQLLSSQKLKEVEKFLNKTAAMAISNAQKYQSLEKRYKKAHLGKKDLIQSLYHEFNTPLAVMKGNLEILKMTCDEQKLPELIHLENSVNQVTDVSNRLLEMANLEKESPENLINRKVNVFDVIDNLRWQINDEKNLRIVHEKNSYEVKGALEWLEKGFYEILKNAFFYAKSEIEITYAKKKNHLLISFKNDGDAVHSSHLNRVFDKFYRVDPSRTKATGGVGLGLALVKLIINKHQGSVKMISNANQGVEVLVELPLS